jgi:hypothetical protein
MSRTGCSGSASDFRRLTKPENETDTASPAAYDTACNRPSGNWAGKVVAEVMGLDAGDRAERNRISRLLAMWKKNGTLKTGIYHNTRTGRDQTTIVVGERV